MKFFRSHVAPLTLAVVTALTLFASDASAQQRQRQPAPAPAPSQQAPSQSSCVAASGAELPAVGTKIVVADVICLLRESESAKQVRAQVDRQLNVFQSEVSKQENDLRAAEQELGKQRSVLAPEAFNQRVQEFEKRVAEAKQNARDRRQTLDKAFNEGMDKVQRAMVEVIAQVAAERKYEIVLPRSQVVVVATALDITPEVLRRLNQKLPQVTVNIPR